MVEKTTLRTRIKNAMNAFKGKPVGSIQFGLHVQRCDKCEFKKETIFRDNLLVTAGARAAYMDDANVIDIPSGVEGETELALFISRMVDCYMALEYNRTFDKYIEDALKHRYGLEKGD